MLAKYRAFTGWWKKQTPETKATIFTVLFMLWVGLCFVTDFVGIWVGGFVATYWAVWMMARAVFGSDDAFR